MQGQGAAGLGVTGPGGVLLVSADPMLVEPVLEVAATVDVQVEQAGSVPQALARWSSARLVLVGADMAAALVEARQARDLPHRDAVTLLAGRDSAELWRDAVELGACRVALLPECRGWLSEALPEQPSLPAAPLVGVIGGRGGAGASCLAVSLAMSGRRLGHAAVLVDADPFGGGIDLVLGAEHTVGLRWPDLAHAAGRIAPQPLLQALLQVEGLRVLSWDRGDRLTVPAAAVLAVTAALRAAVDLVVVDLPRTGEPAGEALLTELDLLLLVVPAEVRATAAAARVAARVAPYCRDVRAVVRGPAPADLEPELVAESVGLPLAAWLPPEPGLTAALERGDAPAVNGRGPLARVATRLLEELPGLTPDEPPWASRYPSVRRG